MAAIFAEYPILSSVIALVVFVIAGAVDLIVLKNKAVAFVLWVFGFFVVLAPLTNLPAIEGVEALLIVLFAAFYIFAVYKTYDTLKGPVETKEGDRSTKR